MFDLLQAEFKFQGRHWSWRLAILVSFAFGLFVVNRQTPDVDIAITGAYFLTKTFAIQLLLLPILVALFAVQSSVRDFESDMTQLVYSGGNRRAASLMARFTALVGLSLLTYCSFGAGMFTGLYLNFEVDVYLALTAMVWSLVVLALPNLLLVGAVMMAVGLKVKHSVGLYFSACVLFFAYQFLLVFTGSPLMANRVLPDPQLLALLTWLDPYGLTAYFAQVNEWQPAQKNTLLPALSGALLGNRILVVAMAVLIIVLLMFKQQKAYIETSIARSSSGWMGQWRQGVMSLLRPVSTAKSKPVQVNSSLPSSRLLTVAAMEWRLTIKTKLFVAMSLALLVVIGSEIYFGIVHLENLGTTAIASTKITMNRFIADVLPRFAGLFIIIIAAELCWRDVESGIKGLVNTTPVTNRQLLLGRLLALSFVPVFFVTLAIAISIVMQITFGGEVQLVPYLTLYVYNLLPLLWLVGTCVVIHVLLPNKYLALAVSFIFYLLTHTNMLPNIGLEHPLWRLGVMPMFTYSEFTGFGGQVDGFWGYNALRYSLLAMAGLVAFVHFRRGEELAKLANVSWQRKDKLAMTAMAMVTVVAFTNIVEKTWMSGQYQSTTARTQWKAEYEQKYAHYLGLPSLKPEAVDTHITLFPKQRSMQLQADYQLVNRSDKAIDTLLITTPRPLNYQVVTLAGAELIEYDEKFATGLYQFAQPIEVGGNAQLQIRASYQQNGYLGELSDNFLTEAFSYFRFLRYLPWFGFLPHYQIKHPEMRAQYSLPELATKTLEQDMETHNGDMSALLDWAQLTTKITTDAGQIAIAPGQLVSTSQQGERSTFEYQTHGPIRNLGHLVSTRLPRLTKQVQGVNLEVFYPENKEQYAERHMEAMVDTVKYGNRHFGQINSKDLRLMPISDFFPSTGYALPQTIFIGEDVGFHVDMDNADGFDHIYRRTAHEVAHQWWGHGLNGAPTEGEGVLVETLAKYTEMVLLRNKYGHDYVKRLIEYEQQRYYSGRGRSQVEELPLYRGDESHLIYSKGAVAMYALHQVLGEEAVNAALAKLVKHHFYPNVPATSLDLIRYLQEGKTQAQQALVQRWFVQIEMPDLAISQVHIEKVGEQYQSKVCIVNHSTSEQASSSPAEGRESLPAQYTTWVSLRDKSGNDIGELSFAQLNNDHRPSCKTKFYQQKPHSVDVDPNLLLLDKDRSNNHWISE